MAKLPFAPIPMDVKLMNMVSTALFVFLALLVLVGAGRWALQLNLFSIAGVSIRGDTAHNNAVTLRANTLPKLQGNYFTTDLVKAREAFEATPWIRKALVQREFPNRLRVHLHEHQAAAYWGPDGDARLVNTFGEIFEANPGDVENDQLHRLMGPEGQSASLLQMLHAIGPQFASVGLQVRSLELSARGDWRVNMDDDATVEMGRGDMTEITQRVSRFVKTLQQVLNKYGRALDSADLRYAQGYAIRIHGVSTEVLAQDTKINR